jgi:tetratricopeptide (TPR) repeat protein
MKKYTLFLFVSIFLLAGCESYVMDIDELIDEVKDEDLNSENEIGFLTTGVKIQFARTQDQLFTHADGLSDQSIFDGNVPTATFTGFKEIDRGEITLDNIQVVDVFNSLGQLRFQADDLVRRVNAINITTESAKNNALFNGYLYGGIARYFYATYFGLNPTEGGGIIDNGPFIPSADMYDLAVEKFQLAIQVTNDAYEIRLVNSLIARAYLYKGDFSDASTFAAQGLILGDEPFESLHSIQDDNYYWFHAGANRKQYVVAQGIVDYISADSLESARIQVAEITGSNDSTYYYQVKYPNSDSPIPNMTWQENNLMLAELSLRGAGGGDALQLVNEVRSSHGLNNLTAVDLDVVYDERAKELFCTGSRLPDQRRFNRWHLDAGKWQYLPITEQERNNNPNL